MAARAGSQSSGAHACADCPVSVSRREFVAAAGGAFALLLWEATTIEARAGGRATEKRYPMPASDGVSIDRGSELILVRYQGQVWAFNLACPHENYALRWRDKDLRFQCPEHESRYQPDGTFVDGRATRNMDRLAVRRDGGDVVVDLDVLYRSDKQPDQWKAAVVRP